jgi:excisionase family DNA binding protein
MCDRLLLTVAEVGKSLSLKRSKVYELIRSGRIPSVRLDGSRRVLASELREFVEQLRTAGEGE